ncbi:Serine/threonine-protein kinase [Podospora fimiseda]|uniref:non-specific serine/threonine protein kinase n=1 Tax=Podospora fimiseda TaxID=252190 RepID=A0AAN7BCX1_9PEZI|nr:Serine/threonine-protein kinase [Podospora fimiseda]
MESSTKNQTETREPSPIREFPTSGFDLADPSKPLEEEKYAWYSAQDFYPATLGQLFKEDKYQVICKLGYGSASTTWLCRDLTNHRYVVVKIYAAGQGQIAREVAALKRISDVLSKTEEPVKHHHGAQFVRTLLDSFEVSRPGLRNTNICLVFNPLGMTLGETRQVMYNGQMPLGLVRGIMFNMLLALDFLHRKVGMVHGDFQEDNIMMGVEDPEDIKEIEDEELETPSKRKVYKDHVIYASRLLNLCPTHPVLCDFGEARFGKESYGEEAMPDVYRAPEVLLRLNWNEKIDIWAFGMVLWTLVQGTNLLKSYPGGRWKSALPHMARIISVIGPPPEGFLDGVDAADEYFEEDGKLKDGVEVEEISLEKELTALYGVQRERFLAFLKRILVWDPEKRPSALQLLKDPWFVPGPEDEDDSDEHSDTSEEEEEEVEYEEEGEDEEMGEGEAEEEGGGGGTRQA